MRELAVIAVMLAFIAFAMSSCVAFRTYTNSQVEIAKIECGAGG